MGNSPLSNRNDATVSAGATRVREATDDRVSESPSRGQTPLNETSGKGSSASRRRGATRFDFHVGYPRWRRFELGPANERSKKIARVAFDERRRRWWRRRRRQSHKPLASCVAPPVRFWMHYAVTVVIVVAEFQSRTQTWHVWHKYRRNNIAVCIPRKWISHLWQKTAHICTV